MKPIFALWTQAVSVINRPVVALTILFVAAFCLSTHLHPRMAALQSHRGESDNVLATLR